MEIEATKGQKSAIALYCCYDAQDVATTQVQGKY